MEVDAAFVQDVLRGDTQTEMRVRFIKKLEDAVPVGEEWFIGKYLNLL